MSQIHDGIRKIAEQLYGAGHGGDASAIERLTRENEQLKVARRKDAETIATLRSAKDRYRSEYLALKEKYKALRSNTEVGNASVSQ